MEIIRLPTKSGDEFILDSSLFLELCDCYPEIEVSNELNHMRAWLLTNPSRRKTKRGIKRFINSWLCRASKKSINTYDMPGIPPGWVKH